MRLRLLREEFQVGSQLLEPAGTLRLAQARHEAGITEALMAARTFGVWHYHVHELTDRTLFGAEDAQRWVEVVLRQDVAHLLERPDPSPVRELIAEIEELDLPTNDLDPSQVLRQHVHGARDGVRPRRVIGRAGVANEERLFHDVEEPALEIEDRAKQRVPVAGPELRRLFLLAPDAALLLEPAIELGDASRVDKRKTRREKRYASRDSRYDNRGGHCFRSP